MVKKKTISLIDMEIGIIKLFNYRRHIIVPNISWGFDIHECDLFIIRKSGYAVEVEIKRSKRDLLNDFNKMHQHIDTQHRICELYYAIPKELYDSCKDLIPKNAGIITCRANSTGKNKVQHAMIKRKAKRIKNARRLTDDEILKVAKLGVMRVWKLKKQLSKLK